jgi:hypothetical protein
LKLPPKPWQVVVPTLATALILIGVAMWVSCDLPTSDPHRFVREGNYTVEGESCSVRTMRDTYTGCEYLLSCNAITAMPHTCTMDQPEGLKP